MKLNGSLIVCAVLALASCSPKVTSNIVHTYPKLESLDDVAMLGEKDRLPADAEWMGTIDVKGKAGYDRLAELTRFKAWEEGASYVKVKSYGSDGARSDIHAMNSDVYRADTVTRVAQPAVTPRNTATENHGTQSSYITSNNTPYVAATVGGVQSLETPGFTSPNSLRFYAGYGRRLNKLNPSMNEFEKMHYGRMLNGVMMGADYVRYFNSSRTSGLGFRYQIMHGSAKDYATITFEDGSPSLEGLLDDYVNISYVGPIYSKREVTRDGQNFFMYNVGLGLLFYRSNATIAGKERIVAGLTSGITLDFNYAHMLSDNLSIGADFSLTSGTLMNYDVQDYYGETITVDGQDQSQWEGLLHMGICAQLVYTF